MSPELFSNKPYNHKVVLYKSVLNLKDGEEGTIWKIKERIVGLAAGILSIATI